MSRPLEAWLLVLGAGVVGYVGFPVVAALLGAATWSGVYDDSLLANSLFWLQMLSFATAVVALAGTVLAMWRRRRARP